MSTGKKEKAVVVVYGFLLIGGDANENEKNVRNEEEKKEVNGGRMENPPLK